MLNLLSCFYCYTDHAECHHAECRYAEYQIAECHYAESLKRAVLRQRQNCRKIFVNSKIQVLHRKLIFTVT